MVIDVALLRFAVGDELAGAFDGDVAGAVLDAEGHTRIAPKVLDLEQAMGAVEEDEVLAGVEGVPHHSELGGAVSVDGGHDGEVRLFEELANLFGEHRREH